MAHTHGHVAPHPAPERARRDPRGGGRRSRSPSGASSIGGGATTRLLIVGARLGRDRLGDRAPRHAARHARAARPACCSRWPGSPRPTPPGSALPTLETLRTLGTLATQVGGQAREYVSPAPATPGAVAGEHDRRVGGRVLLLRARLPRAEPAARPRAAARAHRVRRQRPGRRRAAAVRRVVPPRGARGAVRRLAAPDPGVGSRLVAGRRAPRPAVPGRRAQRPAGGRDGADGRRRLAPLFVPGFGRKPCSG